MPGWSCPGSYLSCPVILGIHSVTDCRDCDGHRLALVSMGSFPHCRRAALVGVCAYRGPMRGLPDWRWGNVERSATDSAAMTAAQAREWANLRLPNGWTVRDVVERPAGFDMELHGPETVRDFSDVAYALDADMTIANHGDDLVVVVMAQIGFDVIIVRREFPDALREVG